MHPSGWYELHMHSMCQSLQQLAAGLMQLTETSPHRNGAGDMPYATPMQTISNAEHQHLSSDYNLHSAIVARSDSALSTDTSTGWMGCLSNCVHHRHHMIWIYCALEIAACVALLWFLMTIASPRPVHHALLCAAAVCGCRHTDRSRAPAPARPVSGTPPESGRGCGSRARGRQPCHGPHAGAAVYGA